MDRLATCEVCLRTERESTVDRCSGPSKLEILPECRAEVQSRLSGLFQHLKEVRDGKGKDGKGGVRVYETRALTEAVEESSLGGNCDCVCGKI